MLRLIFLVLIFIAVWRWSDWRNWKLYYPTILLVMMGDYLYNFLTYTHSMWELHSFFGGHVVNSLLLNFTLLPCTVLLFLTHFPYTKSFMSKVAFIFVSVVLYSSIEYIQSLVGAITYHNGWNLGWTTFFNIVMFTVIAIHHKNPIYAYPISLVVVVLFFKVLDIPVVKWK